MNIPETQSGGSLEPVGSVSLEELEAKLERQARAGDVDGFHATLREIDSLSAQDRTLLAMLAVCLTGNPPNVLAQAGRAEEP
jgi:hypothetical protein